MIINYENIDKKNSNLELDKIYPKVMVQLSKQNNSKAFNRLWEEIEYHILELQEEDEQIYSKVLSCLINFELLLFQV